jgi:alpha-beta hydrolase superfamily lysophospholipase
MTKTTNTFLSSDKKTAVRYYVYEPVKGTAPFAVLQLIHGMNEYIEKYEGFISFLTDTGVVVCGCDQLGHGETAAESDAGFFAEKSGWEHITDDQHVLYEIMRKRYRSLTYVMFGHSMGSIILRRYITLCGKDSVPDGAVICGTCGKKRMLGAGIALSSLIMKVKGARYRSKFIDNLAFKGINARFSAENDASSWLAKNAEHRRKMNADSRMNVLFTVSAYNDMFKLLQYISDDAWAGKVPESLPLLLISGSDDPFGGYGAGVTAVYESLRDAGVNEVSMKLYDGDRHEILFEDDKTAVYADIARFIRTVYENKVLLTRTAGSLS